MVRVSTSKQTGDDDVLVHQPSTEVSQQGTVAQCHGGNDASEHRHRPGDLQSFIERSTPRRWLAQRVAAVSSVVQQCLRSAGN